MTPNVQRSRRILLVEDDPDLREELADTLMSEGHAVTTSLDGWDALHQMRVSRPDIVVLDLLMPVMSGWHFRAEQKRDPALADIPVVVISCSESPAAIAVDADLYMRKPLHPDALLRAIDDVIETRARKQHPVEAAQAERLAALGTLAAGMAHEINNPLTYVLLQLATAERRLETLAAAAPNGRSVELGQIHALVQSALEGAERIRDVASNVRAFARVDDLNRSLIDVHRVLDASAKLLGHEIRHRAKLERDYGEVPAVLANEGRLCQVFLNLMKNAVQAIPEGNAAAHTIRIRTATDQSGCALVEISDSGPGIPDHILGRIFEPFFTTKPAGEGSGLGLAISHGIVRSLGGALSTDRRPQGGTTMRVLLPAAASAAASAQACRAPEHERAVARRRVLVVDDEAAVCRAVQEALGPDHDIVVCSSGLHALGILARDGSFDVILCDLHMPEVTGISLFERLSRSKPNLAARMIFMTAGAFTEAGREFEEASTRPFIEKPIDFKRLRALLLEESW